jgi:hypothetical protein
MEPLNIKPSINIVGYRKVGKLYDIVATTARELPVLDVASLFREKFAGRMAAVAGTFRTVNSSKAETVMRFMAKPTATVKSYSDTASMISLGNCEFTDTAGDIWTAVDEGGTRYLVLQSKDNLDELLDEARQRRSISPAYMANDVAAELGDFAAIVVDDDVKMGFVAEVAGKRVIVDMSDKAGFMYDVTRNNVVEAIEPDRRIVDTSALRKSDSKALFDVLSKVYTKEYLAKYRAMIGA